MTIGDARRTAAGEVGRAWDDIEHMGSLEHIIQDAFCDKLGTLASRFWITTCQRAPSFRLFDPRVFTQGRPEDEACGQEVIEHSLCELAN